MDIQWDSVGIGLAVAGYLVIVYDLLCEVENEDGLSFATFGLYALLDGLVFYSLRAIGGNTVPPAVFAIGSLVIFSLLLYKKQTSWKKFEIGVAVLVVVCFSIKYFVDDDYGAIAGSISMGLATFPQFAKSFKKPNNRQVPMWTIFFLCNMAFVWAGKSWALKEVLLPAICAGCALLLIILNSRKELPVENALIPERTQSWEKTRALS